MIALLGSGNVAHWLAQRLRNSKEFPIAQVYSRHLDNAKELAQKIGAQAIDDLNALNPDCEVYVFSLKDDAYAEVLQSLPFELPLAVHTAGTVSQSVFAGHARHYGVIYPLQTFSKSMDMTDFQVPLCVERDMTGDDFDKVMRLAAELSETRYEISEAQRGVLHLAAVFACNFSNAMACVADGILKDSGMKLDMLMPLMQQTLDKLKIMSPAQAQTGPAARADKTVMEKHINALPTAELQALYRSISEYIMKKCGR